MRDASGHHTVKRVPWYDTAGFVAWFLLIAALTLRPAAVTSDAVIRPFCIFCGDLGGADLVRNILLFAPAGLFLMRRGVSVLAAIVLGFALSASIEFTQMFIPGRFTTLRDIITNGLGAGAGAIFYALMEFGYRTKSRVALAAASALPVIAVATTGWLMQPVSTDGRYFGHWVPERPYYAPWNGQILAADVDGLPAPSGPLDDTDAVRSALEAGRPVHLAFIQGDPPTALSALFHIVDDSKREILMIGAHGVNLVVRPRLRANEARLDFTDQRFVGFLEGTSPGDTVALEVVTDSRGRSCVSAAHATACAPYPSIGAAWQIILWKGTLPALPRRALHGATILLFLLPLGILGTQQPRRTGLTLFAAATIAMILAGRALGLAWPGAAEFLPVVGLVAVMLGRRRVLGSDRIP